MRKKTIEFYPQDHQIDFIKELDRLFWKSEYFLFVLARNFTSLLYAGTDVPPTIFAIDLQNMPNTTVGYKKRISKTAAIGRTCRCKNRKSMAPNNIVAMPVPSKLNDEVVVFNRSTTDQRLTKQMYFWTSSVGINRVSLTPEKRNGNKPRK